jgi:hypothetical protein
MNVNIQQRYEIRKLQTNIKLFVEKNARYITAATFHRTISLNIGMYATVHT